MTKKIFTVTEVIEKIQDECDLQEETMFDEPELISYLNEAIDECEAEIHNENSEYFNTSSPIALVSGTKAYPLPANMYANKIKLVQFKRSLSDYHPVTRIEPDEVAAAEESLSDRPECYLLQNEGTAIGVQIVFYPTPKISEPAITLWYIRNAERVSGLTDKVDIPEFISFIFAYMKVKVARKELSPLLADRKEELETQRALMRETLSDMVIDKTETLPMDTTFYEDFDNSFGINFF